MLVKKFRRIDWDSAIYWYHPKCPFTFLLYGHLIPVGQKNKLPLIRSIANYQGACELETTSHIHNWQTIALSQICNRAVKSIRWILSLFWIDWCQIFDRCQIFDWCEIKFPYSLLREIEKPLFMLSRPFKLITFLLGAKIIKAWEIPTKVGTLNFHKAISIVLRVWSRIFDIHILRLRNCWY